MRRVNFSKLLENSYHDRKIVIMAAEIIEKMMSINPNDRPDAVEILQHDLFKNLLP